LAAVARRPSTDPAEIRTIPPAGPLLPPGGAAPGLTDATSKAGEGTNGACVCAASTAIAAIASQIRAIR
jgi:hypothetical protein